MKASASSWFERVRSLHRMMTLGFSLGDGVLERIRLAVFLVGSRFVRGSQSKAFRICVNGTSLTVHIRNNFADAFILDEAFRGGEYEHGLPEEAPRVIFDVGANIGFVALYFKTRYPHARIFCFEPDPGTFTQLERNTKQFPDIRCFPYALGAQEGTRTFYRSPVFHMRNSLIAKHASDEHISVEVVTFRKALEDAQVPSVDLLKIDIEGGELELFENDFPFTTVRRIVGELHPHVWPPEAYERLIGLLRSRYTLSVERTDRKVFFTASSVANPSQEEAVRSR